MWPELLHLEPMAANGNNHSNEEEFIYHQDVSEVDATPVKISSQAWLVKMANWIDSIKVTSQYDGNITVYIFGHKHKFNDGSDTTGYKIFQFTQKTE